MIQDPVVVGIEIDAVDDAAVEVLDEQVRDVVIVLEVERSGFNVESGGTQCRTGEAHDLLHHSRVRLELVSVAEDDVGQAVE
ncbi:MAG: hypothetical protein GY716_14175 [bacterium]|nr:hypothetical protein [bacterium]